MRVATYNVNSTRNRLCEMPNRYGAYTGCWHFVCQSHPGIAFRGLLLESVPWSVPRSSMVRG